MQETDSTDRIPTLVQGSTPPPDAQAMVERLRSEAVESEKDRKALLLHEAGELAERVTGDEVAAAKDFLSAYGADDTFCEPLEALVRILERRRSLRNLGRVLESLVKSARSPEEKARALRARAIEALTVRNKPDEAHSFLLEAVTQCPEDATSWLMLERDAAVRGDSLARTQALAKRVEIARDPEWACLLRLDYARILVQAGETELALQNLTEASEMPAQGAFRACELGLRFAEQAGLAEKSANFAKQLAAIVLEGESGPRGRGMPAQFRGANFVVETLLQAANAYRIAGLVDDEIESIDFALEHDPSNIRAAYRRLDALLRAERKQDASALASQLIEQNNRPELALHLYTILVEAALLEGNRERALELATAMNSLPDYARSTADSLVVSSMVPRLLLLDLLLDGARPAEWCQAVEQEARSSSNPEIRAGALLAAATAHVLAKHDLGRVRTLAEEALSLGVAKAPALGVARGLSILLGNQDWREKLSTELLACGDDPVEKVDLVFDLTRFRLGKGDVAGAVQTLSSVPSTSPRFQIATALQIALLADRAPDKLFSALESGRPADSPIDPASQLALNIARVRIAALRGDPEAIKSARKALISCEADDPIVGLLRARELVRNSPGEAARELAFLGDQLTDDSSQLAIRYTSAILYALSGETVKALEELPVQSDNPADPANIIRSIWHRAVPELSDSAHGATFSAFGGDWQSLERVGAAIVQAEFGAGLEESVAALVNSADAPMRTAGTLLRAAIEKSPEALEALEAIGPTTARLTARWSLHEASNEGNVGECVSRAEKWCELGGGIPAALEVVLAGRDAADRRAEVRGRKLLARTLGQKSGELMEAGARLLESFASPLDRMPSVNSTDPYAQTSLLLSALEHFPPGCAPQNRAKALLELADSIEGGNETLIEMAGWSALARGDLAEGRQLFLMAIDKSGSDVTRSALEGLLEIETLENDGQVSREWARWAERLATLLSDSSPEDAAVEWEKIGIAYWDRLGDQARGERALEKAFSLDPSRTAAFDRVFRAVRGRKEDDHLLEIVRRRLEVADSAQEQAKLNWETARVLRQKGDRDGALAALEAVTSIEPDHIGALALSAEIYVGRSEFGRAADAFARLSRQAVPQPQMLAAALGAADLYEFKLNEPAKAVEVLVAAEKAGIADVALIERIVRPAYAAENWDVAVVHLSQLASIRSSKESRIEAIRSAVTIYREKLAALPSALPLIVQWLRDAPADVEAVEMLLDSTFDRRIVQPQIAKALPRLVQDLARDPLVEDRLRMTAKVAYFLEDQPRELLASSSLVALHLAEPFEVDREKLLVRQLARGPSMALDPQALKRLASPDEPQPITQLLRILGPATAQALGPTLEILGVGKRDKIDVRAQNALRNEIAAWAGAFGVTEFDFYISPKDADILAGIPGEPHSLVVGNKWQSSITMVQRARLARELCALERGASMALVRDDTAVAALIAAACMLMNISINVPNYSVLAETQKQLGKTISRKIRRDLTETAEMVGRGVDSGYDLRSYKGQLMLSLDRAAIVATGLPTAALADLGAGTSIASHPRAAAMLRFVWSDDFLELQQLLGLGMGK